MKHSIYPQQCDRYYIYTQAMHFTLTASCIAWHRDCYLDFTVEERRLEKLRNLPKGTGSVCF